MVRFGVTSDSGLLSDSTTTGPSAKEKKSIQKTDTKIDARKFDTRQFDTRQLDTIKFDTIKFDERKFDTRKVDTRKFDTRKFDTRKFDTRKFDTRKFDSTNLIQKIDCRSKKLSRLKHLFAPNLT